MLRVASRQISSPSTKSIFNVRTASSQEFPELPQKIAGRKYLGFLPDLLTFLGHTILKNSWGEKGEMVQKQGPESKGSIMLQQDKLIDVPSLKLPFFKNHPNPELRILNFLYQIDGIFWNNVRMFQKRSNFWMSLRRRRETGVGNL